MCPQRRSTCAGRWGSDPAWPGRWDCPAHSPASRPSRGLRSKHPTPSAGRRALGLALAVHAVPSPQSQSRLSGAGLAGPCPRPFLPGPLQTPQTRGSPLRRWPPEAPPTAFRALHARCPRSSPPRPLRGGSGAPAARHLGQLPARAPASVSRAPPRGSPGQVSELPGAPGSAGGGGGTSCGRGARLPAGRGRGLLRPCVLWPPGPGRLELREGAEEGRRRGRPRSGAP